MAPFVRHTTQYPARSFNSRTSASSTTSSASCKSLNPSTLTGSSFVTTIKRVLGKILEPYFIEVFVEDVWEKITSPVMVRDGETRAKWERITLTLYHTRRADNELKDLDVTIYQAKRHLPHSQVFSFPADCILSRACMFSLRRVSFNQDLLLVPACSKGPSFDAIRSRISLVGAAIILA